MKAPRLLLALALAGSTAAHAETMFTLNFGGLRNNEQVLNFYKGGTGSLGSGPGANFGFTFSPAFVAISATAPYGPSTVGELNGSSAIMDVTGGFTSVFSFYYEAANSLGSVTLWSGLDGTGTQLASFALTSSALWNATGGAFSGTAHSALFSGTPGTTFDQITNFGTVVPEPSSLLLLATGSSGLVLEARRRRASASTLPKGDPSGGGWPTHNQTLTSAPFTRGSIAGEWACRTSYGKCEPLRPPPPLRYGMPLGPDRLQNEGHLHFIRPSAATRALRS